MNHIVRRLGSRHLAWLIRVVRRGSEFLCPRTAIIRAFARSQQFTNRPSFSVIKRFASTVALLDVESSPSRRRIGGRCGANRGDNGATDHRSQITDHRSHCYANGLNSEVKTNLSHSFYRLDVDGCSKSRADVSRFPTADSLKTKQQGSLTCGHL